MVLKVKSWGLHKNTNFKIVTLVVLLLIATVIIVGSIDDSNTSYKQHKPKTYDASYDYTYESSDFSCHQVKAHPTGDETVNYCSGKLEVKINNSGVTKEFNITDTSHLIKSGTSQDLSAVTQLAKGKTKLYLTFFPGSKTDLETIGYQAQ